MTQGRSLRLFLVDGTPNGLLTAEIMNWTGHVRRGRERSASLLRSPMDGCNLVAPRANCGHLARQTPLFTRGAPCFARPLSPSRRAANRSRPLFGPRSKLAEQGAI